MKSWWVAVFLLFGCFAQAQDIGVVIGARADSADAQSGDSNSGQSNWQAGGVAKFQAVGDLWIRSGFIYTNRAYSITSPSGSATSNTFSATYFEVPVGLMYKFSDYGGVFAGGDVALNLSNSCPGGNCTNVSSSPIFAQFGASFKFAPQMGLELYYEMSSSKLMDEVSNPRAVMVNFMITFD